MFEAVILAGGQGTRLKSVTGELPKPMLDVNGSPFLYVLMKRLEESGCNHIILSLCYRAHYIIDKINNDKPVKCPVDFVIEDTPLGTGGGVKLSAKKANSEKLVIINGDTYCDINYDSLIDYSSQSDFTICAVHVDDVSRYGTLDIDSNNNILSLNEKETTGAGYINGGTYVIKAADITRFPKDQFSFEKDYIPLFKGKLKAFISRTYFIDIGIPEDYYTLCRKIK